MGAKKLIFSTLLVVVLVSACGPNCEACEEVQPQINTTSENWDWIFLGLESEVESNYQEIGAAIYNWEQENPDREIVDMDIIHFPPSYSFNSNKVHGISIYSKKAPNE